MDLFDRKKFGDDTVDEKSVQKHLKEFWRLATILTGDEEITSTGQPQKDMTLAIAKVALRPASQFKQVMEKIPGITMKPIMTALKKIFLRT